MKWRIGVSISAAVMLVSGTNARAQLDDLEVTLSSAARDYCHFVRFPEPWTIQPFDDRTHERLFFGSEASDYEFRAEDVLSTKFLVAGFTEYVGRNYYTINRYRVDMSSSAAPIVPASSKAWDASAVVPIARKSAFGPGGPLPTDKVLKFNGFEFVKSGENWDQSFHGAARLSPDQAWLVLQSTTSTPDRYARVNVYFDFFNADTGNKLFTLEGVFSSPVGGYADSLLGKTGWVTERFFIISLGKNKQRCLVCDFAKGASKKGAKQ